MVLASGSVAFFYFIYVWDSHTYTSMKKNVEEKEKKESPHYPTVIWNKEKIKEKRKKSNN